jgi:hypothetical protein
VDLRSGGAAREKGAAELIDMAKTVLLVGRTSARPEEIRWDLELDHNYELVTATGMGDVLKAFADSQIDHVIMGAGIDLDTRLEIVREVFARSDTTTVHMKSRLPAAEGFLPFARSILTGLKTGTG